MVNQTDNAASRKTPFSFRLSLSLNFESRSEKPKFRWSNSGHHIEWRAHSKISNSLYRRWLMLPTWPISIIFFLVCFNFSAERQTLSSQKFMPILCSLIRANAMSHFRVEDKTCAPPSVSKKKKNRRLARNINNYVLINWQLKLMFGSISLSRSLSLRVKLVNR